MVLRHALLVAALVGLAASVSAQTTTPATGTAAGPREAAFPAAAEAASLIGREVKCRDGAVVGKIESVHVAPDGAVDSVMVGLADREVEVGRKDLQVTADGTLADDKTVTVALTGEQLDALPPYRYKDATWRGTVFGERGVRDDPQRPTADSDRTVSTGDFNLAGEVSASALIGARIVNGNKDTVGTVEDLFVDDRGAIATVVVSVGGFLGVGARSVGVKWSDLQRRHDGGSVVLVTRLGKDELEALPPYVAQLRKPAPREQAAAPH